MAGQATTEPLEVVEVIRRSQQGVTLPFLCKVADGRFFWAKGSIAGKRALCCEWIAGRLAQAFKLPIPPFAQLFVDACLIQQSLIDTIQDLGSGLVFGSEDVGDAQEIGIEDARRIMRDDEDLARRVLAFDWWIQNEDRTLGERGGNPNILISSRDAGMRIIDHNIAFDRTWSATSFADAHIFFDLWNRPRGEWMVAIQAEMRLLLPKVDTFWGELPDEWVFLDESMAAGSDLSLAEVKKVLAR